VAEGIRTAVEREVADRGPEALHAELDPEIAANVDPADRKRVARLTELVRAGVEPPASSERLWSAAPRKPTDLYAITTDIEDLDLRIAARVEGMVAAGAIEEVRRADAANASRTARAAIGFAELLRGDVAATKVAQRRFARRQLTWLRRMEGVEVIERGGRGDEEIAADITASLAG
jgi:tRNA dimethylallyltransferase